MKGGLQSIIFKAVLLTQVGFAGLPAVAPSYRLHHEAKDKLLQFEPEYGKFFDSVSNWRSPTIMICDL